MTKALSVTLKTDNILWLKGQAATTARGSLSEVLDAIVTEARLAGRTEGTAIRSVKGTIDLADDDPDLLTADEYVRAAFDKSLRQPVLVRETTGRVKTGNKRARG